MNSNRLFVIASEMQNLQEEISRLNEIGIDSMLSGKLRTASQEFHHALALVKALSEMKQHFFRLRKALSGVQPDPFRQVWSAALSATTLPALIKKPCDPIPIDVSSSPISLHWETMASVALMYNASLVHVAAEKFTPAKNMLDLARGLLQAKLIEHAIFDGMEENKYAASVVMAIYMAYGRVILGIPNGPKKQAHQALKLASLLLSQLKASKELEAPPLTQGQELPRSPMTMMRSSMDSPPPQSGIFDPCTFVTPPRSVSERSLMQHEDSPFDPTQHLSETEGNIEPIPTNEATHHDDDFDTPLLTGEISPV